jgi:hypothetical protein
MNGSILNGALEPPSPLHPFKRTTSKVQPTLMNTFNYPALGPTRGYHPQLTQARDSVA